MIHSIKVNWSPESRKQLLPWSEKSARVLAFVQARVGSNRFPNKIYQDLNGAPLLYHTIARAKEATLVDDVIVCSPQPLDVPEGIRNYVGTGDEDDVLSRYYACMIDYPCDYVLRLTSDCPLLDPFLIDFIIHSGVSQNADYASNVVKLTFPDGVDCELISKRMLAFLNSTVKSKYGREHVTIAVRDNPKFQDDFAIVSVESVKDYSRMKLSVDVPEDLQRLREMEAR